MSETLYRFCSLPDSLTTEEIGARWGKTRLLWCVTGNLPGLTTEQWVAALAEAWGYWQAVCGLAFAPTDSARVADVLHGTGSIDGRGKTLAWSELPNGSDTRLRQMYDRGEDWVREIDPVAVACHEIGHALGLGHDNGGGAALMDPYYSPRIRKPQPRDIARIQKLYGQPVPVPPPPPPVPPAGELTAEQAVMEFAAVLRRAGYEVAKR